MDGRDMKELLAYIGALQHPSGEPSVEAAALSDERIENLIAAAKEIDRLSLMICSPQAWLNEPERDRIAKAILQVRAALALFAPSGEQAAPEDTEAFAAEISDPAL